MNARGSRFYTHRCNHLKAHRAGHTSVEGQLPALQPLRLQAMLHEFKLDYNQKHFVRNETFKKAADSIQVLLMVMCSCVHVRSGTANPQRCFTSSQNLTQLKSVTNFAPTDILAPSSDVSSRRAAGSRAEDLH